MSQNSCTSCGAIIEGKLNHVQNEDLIKKLNDLKRRTPTMVKSGDVVCRSCIVITSRYEERKKKKLNEVMEKENEVKTVAELKLVEAGGSAEQNQKSKLVDEIIGVIQDLKKKDQSTQVTVKKAERKEKSTQTDDLDLNNNSNSNQNANDLGLLILEHASRMHSLETFATNLVKFHQSTQTAEVVDIGLQTDTKNVLNDLQGNSEDLMFGSINERMKHSLSFTDGIENRQKKKQC